MKGEDARNALKRAACRLFAARGIDGVTTREIVEAAGQRNSGSLHYYFRTKEALVRELIADGAKLINDRRNAWLDACDSDSLSVRDIVEALVWPSTGLIADSQEGTYIRFISELQKNHRELFLDALEKKWASGYQRCLSELRRLLPGLPPAILNQRLIFMGLYLGATLSAREAALESAGNGHHFWSAPHTMENLIDTIQALLEGPISQPTSQHMSPAAVKRDPLGRHIDSAKVYADHIRKSVYGA